MLEMKPVTNFFRERNVDEGFSGESWNVLFALTRVRFLFVRKVVLAVMVAERGISS